MPLKRKNHGRQKKNRGAVVAVRCVQCGASVPKDKAVSRSMCKPLIEDASLDDLKVATIYEAPEVPTYSLIDNYCISCACHLRVVKVRSRIHRKERLAGRVRAN